MKKINENEQIKKIRKELETLIDDPKFKEMSTTFKHTLAQRLGIKEFEEGGLMLQASAPITLSDILKNLDIHTLDLDKLKNAYDSEFSYANIYSYGFW